MQNKIFDVLIVGAGPAGLAAAIYSSRYGMNVAIISQEIGGLASTAHKICNYPGFREITGFELMNKIYEQVSELKVPVFYDEVLDIVKQQNSF